MYGVYRVRKTNVNPNDVDFQMTVTRAAPNTEFFDITHAYADHGEYSVYCDIWNHVSKKRLTKNVDILFYLIIDLQLANNDI